MTTTSILECGFTIKSLESLSHDKGGISPVVVRILVVYEIARYLYIYSSEGINNLFESREVDDEVVIDRLSGDLRYFVGKYIHTISSTSPHTIEGVDTSSATDLLRIRNKEVTRNREERDVSIIRIDGGEHE